MLVVYFSACIDNKDLCDLQIYFLIKKLNIAFKLLLEIFYNCASLSPFYPLPVSLFTPDSPDPIPSLPLFLSALSGSLCRLLLELLELLFDKFKAVAQAHSVVLTHLNHIGVQAQEEGIKLYEQADVSAKIQTVLQVSWQQQ